jgi:hypothetical protein
VELDVALSSVSMWVRDLEISRPAPSVEAPEAERWPRLVYRHCPKCQLFVLQSNFNRSGDGYQHWCRECFRLYFKARGQLHRDQVADGKRRRQEKAKVFVTELLAGSACTDCGFSGAN